MHQHPFVSDLRLYQRLKQLEQAGYLAKYPMLWNRENTFYLTNRGAEYIHYAEGKSISARATKAIKPALQLHEYELSRFWIKWIDSCQQVNLPIVAFYRDGAFKVQITSSSHYMPDGVMLLRIRGKTWAFLLEMDRSTQSASTTFRTKLDHFSHFTRYFRHHPILQQHQVSTMRLITVCKSPQRAANLRLIAKNMGFNYQCAFTHLEEFLDISNPQTAKGWNYKKLNLISAPIFQYPGRAPPCSILS